MDAAVAPLKSQMILVTTRVLELGEAVAAGDLSVAAEVGALAALVGSSPRMTGNV